MTIAKDFAAKASVAFVAAAMLFSMIAPAARAQSAEDMQKMINDLLAQIAALQGGSTTGGSMAAGVCPYTWTRDLKTGATGADVKMLQMFLNADADTRVAATGAGSAGMETETFGPATAAAVSKFQVKYRADVLSPAGLVNPTGYFGPGTRAKANALCVATTGGSTTGGSTTGGSTTGGSTTGSSDLSGEADFEEATLDSADDDTIEEGAEDAPIAELTVKFQDGDASISRLDVKVNPTPSGTDPWDVLETVSLWVDGEMVAEMDASDKDAYQSDDMTLRFTGLDIVAMEDEDLDITIAATVQDGVDSSDQGNLVVSLPSMRFFDADGVADTISGSDFTTDTATVTVGEAGQDDELIVKTASSDPDGTTLQVEDNKKSSWYTVFAFDLDTKDSVNDITLNEVPVTLLFSSSSFSGLVDDYELVIDGTTIDSLVGSASSTGTTTELTFDVDGDVTIDAGDRVTAELRLRFKSLAPGNEGTTVRGKVTSAQAAAIDAEGADTLQAADDQLSGAATGDAHTLRTKGLVLDLTSIDESEKTKTISNTSYDYGVYTYKFDVTAFSDDFYMDEDAAIVDYDIYVNNVLVANPAASSTATLDISGAQDASTADKQVGEGETATFTLTIETATDISGSVKVVVNSVAYSAADDSTEELSTSATPSDDWTSESLILN